MKLLQKQITMLFPLLLCCTSFAKMVELKEDYTAKQAPQKIVLVVEKAASLIAFEKNYEIAEPKKTAIEILPLSKFILYAINPSTKNPVIIINTEWFSQLPEKQQIFLLVRYFLFFKEGMAFSVKLFLLLSLLFEILLIIFLTWALGKKGMPNKKKWLRILASIGIMIIFSLTFLNKIDQKIIYHLNKRYRLQANEMAVKKTGNRQAAIEAFEKLHRDITNEFENDKTFWAPYKTLFQEYADALKQKENGS